MVMFLSLLKKKKRGKVGIVGKDKDPNKTLGSVWHVGEEFGRSLCPPFGGCLPSQGDPTEPPAKAQRKYHSEGITLVRASALHCCLSARTRTSWNIANTCWEPDVCPALGWDLGTSDELGLSPDFEEPTVYLERQSPEHKFKTQSDNR